MLNLNRRGIAQLDAADFTPRVRAFFARPDQRMLNLAASGIIDFDPAVTLERQRQPRGRRARQWRQ
jgi:hypothetical protein